MRSYEETVRGGRNISRGSARTGEGESGQTSAATVFPRFKTIPDFGSQRNPQHEQIPLQVSGAAGNGWFITGRMDEKAAVYGPSHKSQCGE